MNRRAFLRSLGALTALGCFQGGTTGCLARANDEDTRMSRRHSATRRLKMTTRYELEHPLCRNILQPWIDDMRLRSHERLDIHLYGTQTLCPDNDIYQAVQVDTVSFGVVSPGSQIPSFPINKLFDLSFDMPSAEVASQVLWSLFQRYGAVRRELRMVYPLWAWASASLYLHTLDRPVTTPADLAGLKIGVLSTAAAEILRLYGGLPVNIPPGGIAHALLSRLVDGLLVPFPPLPSFNVVSLLRYTTEFPLSNVGFYMVMNREVRQALPASDKRLLEESTGLAMAARCGKLLDEDQQSVRKAMQAAGHTFVTLSEADRSQWRRPITNLGRLHEKSLRTRGLIHDEQLVDDIQALTRRFAEQ